MRRITLVTLIALAWSGPIARSQYVNYMGPGSTPAGDYLRGAGIEAAGLGSFNLNTAMAESIQADTAMRVDSYIREVLRQGRVQYAKHQKQIQENLRAYYNAVRKRILENPQELDVMKGNALNAVLEQLNNPLIADSAFRLAPVTVSIEDIRRIPFQLGEKGVTFSMQRLSVRGKGKWPVAFQDDRYAAERRTYERALDDALEHMIEKKVPEEVIKSYQDAVQGFAIKMTRETWPINDWRRIEANTRLATMRKAADLMKIENIQPALAELDNYGGTTINELRLFMQRHNLRFAVAESPDERTLYPRLYESLMTVREAVVDQGNEPTR